MAQRFISSLIHDYGAMYPGRFVHRLMVEWLTQIVGWSIVDLIGSTWSNVAASGSGTCDATGPDTLVITSPSYAFSTANHNWFLTITGYTGGNATRNGIYKIRKFVGSVGSVYTLRTWKEIGVHHDGLPTQAGLNWRLWAGTDTYCPTSTADIAVLGGTGTTGAGLTNGTRSSVALSIAQAGSVSTLTDAGATFLDSDVGKSITISGSAVGGNNATFVITARLSATQIQYTNALGGNDSFTGSWSITYTFHVHFRSNAWNGYGGVIMSPWASWDPATHTWKVGDLRYTAEHGPNFSGYTPDPTQTVAIFAEADLDHFIFHIHSMWVGSYSPRTFHFMYAAGEMDAFYPEDDPRPCYLWNGFDNYYQAQVPNLYPILGTGTTGGCTFYNGIRLLAYDDLTTVVCYPVTVHCLNSADYNALSAMRRLTSAYPPGTVMYRLPIYVECRTSGFMEHRGKFRHMWAINYTAALHNRLGQNGEFFHLTRGLLVPWGGAKTMIPTVGWIPLG